MFEGVLEPAEELGQVIPVADGVVHRGGHGQEEIFIVFPDGNDGREIMLDVFQGEGK